MMVDTCAIPQDDYFEWEDLMTNRPFTSFDHDFSFLPDYDMPKDLYSCFKSLEQQVSPQPVSLPVYENFNLDWSDTQQSNIDSETASQSSNKTQVALEKQDTETIQTHARENCLRPLLDPKFQAHDDSDITVPPTQNVDYLAFPWHRYEGDLWASRKYLESRRKKSNKHEIQIYDRLRNATWRAIAMGRLKLKKVDPRSFNWLKDQDLTWLHGPFVSQSSRPGSTTNNQGISMTKVTVKAVKQENRPSKSALKKPSLETLLLRGSYPPAKNPKKRNGDVSGQKKRQKQSLRFSPEVLQFSCIPTKFTYERIATTPFMNSEFPKINADISTSLSHQSIKCHPNTSESSVFGHNSKSDYSNFQLHIKQESTEPKLKTVYQVPSGRLRAEQMSEEVAAFSRALREVVDAQHRNISTYQYHTQMLLRPTITA